MLRSVQNNCAATAQIISAIVCVLAVNINTADCRRVCTVKDTRLPGGGFDTKGCEKLDFLDQKIGDAGAHDLSRVLHGDVAISDLYLTSTGLTADGAEHIAKVLEHTNLRGVYMWKNAIGDKGVKHIAEAVARSPSVETLYLGYTGMTDEGAKAVAAMLRGHPKLTTLDLRSNSIGDEGAEALASALHNNSRLAEVFMWNNQVGPTGMSHIIHALQKNDAVHTLHIHNNRGEAEHYRAIEGALAKNRELIAVGHRAEQAIAATIAPGMAPTISFADGR